MFARIPIVRGTVLSDFQRRRSSFHRVCDFMDQVEHVYQAMYEFNVGKCGIEKVIKLIEEAGYDTAQDSLLHKVLHLF